MFIHSPVNLSKYISSKQKDKKKFRCCPACWGEGQRARACVYSTGGSNRMQENSVLSCSRTKLPITQHTLRLFRKLLKYDWSTDQTLSQRIHTENSLLEVCVFILSSITVQPNTKPGLFFTRSSVPYIHRSTQPVSTAVTIEQLS